MLRYIPPAGTQIKIKEIAGWLFDNFLGIDRREDLCKEIKLKYNVKHVYLMSSGRAAMAMLFSILKDINTDPQRTEIVLPSYTCYSVPAAAEIAGLKVRICDIDKETLSYDMTQLMSIDLNKVLCVVSSSLYGYPNDLERIESITNKAGCYFLDDAAQSMNAIVNKRYAGTFGDVGIYSLDKGKNITSIQGGIIVTNNDYISEKIRHKINKLPKASFKQQLSDSISLFIYTLLLNPYLYWIPASLPFLGLGKTIYTTDYSFTQYSRFMSPLSWRLFKRIDNISEDRIRNTNAIIQSLSGIDNISFIKRINESAQPVCLRTPVILKNSSLRHLIINELNNKGIGATTSYPQSIADINDVINYSKIQNKIAASGQYIASHIITLPCNIYLRNTDIQTIKNVFERHTES